MNTTQKNELIVGIFLLAGLVSISLLAFRLGDIDLFQGGKQYLLEARFTSASGLRPGAFVEIAGVRVGKVKEIKYDPEDFLAVVSLKINNDVELPDDSIASIRTSGIIGDKFLKLTPGGSDIILQEGEEIYETEPSINLEELISKYIFESGDKD